MKQAADEWDCLRLAAKAADRARAAEALRPAFEEYMRELGYGPLAIAHAFSALAGPTTVDEALAELAENTARERTVPVALDFEVVGRAPGLGVGNAVTITAVERDGHGIRVRYEIRPPLSSSPRPPRVEARDDHGRESCALGSSIGFAGRRGRPIMLGSFTLPAPSADAAVLRVRMRWSRDFVSVSQYLSQELRVTL